MSESLICSSPQQASCSAELPLGQGRGDTLPPLGDNGIGGNHGQ